MPDLDDDVQALTRDGGLLDQLEGLLPEPVGDPSIGTISRPKAGSAPPWHAEAAGVLMTIHAGARELEDEVLYRLVGRRKLVERGGSHSNTKGALAAIRQLVEGLPDDVRGHVARSVGGWAASARQVGDIGQQSRWTRLRADPGHRPPACPYCATYSLRMNADEGKVRCMAQHCLGHRHTATMVPGTLSAGWIEWPDGTQIAVRQAS